MLEIEKQHTALLLLDFENYSVPPDGYWAQAPTIRTDLSY